MIARKSLIIAITRLASSALTLAGLSILTSILGPENYGIMTWAMAFTATFSFISDLGFGQSHIKKISEEYSEGSCVSTFVVIRLSLAIISAIVTISATFVWSNFLNNSISQRDMEIISIFIAYQLLCNLSTTIIIIYQARMEVAKSQLIQLIDPLSRVILIILFASLGLSIIWIVFAYVVSALLMTILGVYILYNEDIKWQKPSLMQPYFDFALPLMFVVAMGTIGANVDKIIIGAFGQAEDVAYYASSQTLLSLLLSLGTAVSVLTYPEFSKLHHAGKISQIWERTKLAEKYIFLLAMPLTITIFLFADQLVVIFFGSDFEPAGRVMQLMIVATFLILLNQVVGTQLLAVNRPDLSAKIALIYYSTNFISLIILVPKELFGITLFGLSYIGAAIAYLLSTIITFIIARLITYKLSGSMFGNHLFPHIIATVLTGTMIMILLLIYNIDTLFQIIITIFLSFGAYSIILSLVGGLSLADFTFLLETINPRKIKEDVWDEFKKAKEKKI